MVEKKQHSAPKVETLKLNTMMAFNINFNEQHDMVKANHELLVKDRIKAHTILSKRRLLNLKGLHYLLLMESSPTGRLHWHGYCYITDIIQYINNDLPLLTNCSSFCIKFIDDASKWNEYINKQSSIVGLPTISHISFSVQSND